MFISPETCLKLQERNVFFTGFDIEEGVEIRLFEDELIEIIIPHQLPSLIDVENKRSIERLYQALSYFGNDDLLEKFYSIIISEITSLCQKRLCHFFETNRNHVKWRYLSENPNIPESYFKYHLQDIDWKGMSLNTNVSREFLQNRSQINWNIASKNNGIPISFYKHHLHEVDWEELSRHRNLSEAFLNKYWDHIPSSVYDIIYTCPKLTMKFFDQIDNIYFIRYNRYLLVNPNIPNDYFIQRGMTLEEIKSQTDPRLILKYNKSPKIVDYFNRIYPDSKQPIEELILKYRDSGGTLSQLLFHDIPLHMLPELFPDQDLIEAGILDRDDVDLNYIEKYVLPKHANIISAHPKITFEFILRHPELISFTHLCSNPNIPLSYFEYHLDKVDWSRLSRHLSHHASVKCDNFFSFDKEWRKRLYH